MELSLSKMHNNKILSSGIRKYTPIWNKIKHEKYASVKCRREDTLTVINGVKKEKSQDKKKEDGYLLECIPTDEGVMFKLVKDTSINNL